MTIQPSLSPLLLFTQDNAALQQMLSHANYPILAATDIDAACLLIQQKHPRLLLVDTVDNCQQLHTLTNCPILFIGEAEAIPIAFEAGAADYLTQPIHPRLLEQRIQCLLRDSFADFDNIPIMIQSLDDARNIRYVNQHWLQVMGYERDEVLGQPFFKFVESSTERVNKRISRFREKGYLRDEALQLRLKDGRIIDALLDANFITDAATPYSITVIRDISTLKQAESMMQQSQQQMQSILNAMIDSVMVIDSDGCIRRVVTPQNVKMIFTPDELLGKTLFEVTTYDRASRFVGIIKQVLASGEVARLDYDLWANQQQHWFSTSVSPLDDKHVVWVSRNITTNKQAENHLRESEGRYRNLFEMATEGILIIALPDGQIVEANPHICQMLDYKRDEMLTMNLSEIEVAQTFDDSTSQPDSKKFKHFVVSARYKHRDGRYIPVETSSRIIQYQDKPAILCFTRDVTERNRALQAEQEQRMLAEALRDTAAAFNSTVNVDDILDIVMEHSSRIVPRINSANIMLLDKGIINIVRHRGYEEAGYSEAVLQEIRFRVDDIPNLHWVKQKRRALVIKDTHNSQFQWADTKTSDFVRSIVTAPIIVDDEVIGFINLDSNEVNTFSDEHGERLQAFANQAAIAIKNARLFEKIRHDAEELDKSVQQRTIALSNANRALRQQIIQRQEAEAKLLEEQALLKTLVDNIPDSVTVKDANGRIVLLNQAAKNVVNQITGLPTSDDFTAKTVSDLHPDNQTATRLAEREMRVIQNGESIINEEDSYVTRNGDKHWILITKVPLRDSAGEIIGLIAINRDITELKQAQQKLDDERLLLRTLIDHIPDNVFVKDRQGRILIINQAGLRSAGHTALEEVLHKSNLDIYPDNHVARTYYEREIALMEQGEALINKEDLYTNYKGEKRWLLVTKVPIRDAKGEVTGLVSVNRDITELKQTEARLAEERTLLRTLVDTIPDSIYVKDTEHRFILVNQAALKRRGLRSVEDIRGKTDFDFNPSVYAEMTVEQERAILKEGKPLLNLPHTTVHSDGSTHHMLITKLPLRDAEGNIIGLVGTNRDITQLRQAQAQLAEERNLLHTLVETIPDAIYVKDRNYRFILANQAAVKKLGRTSLDDLIGKTDDAFFPSGLADRFMQQEKSIMEQGTAIVNQSEVFTDIYGEYGHLLITKLPLRDAEGNIIGIIGVNHDITELRRIEQQLEQVLTSVRCLLWSAKVVYDGDSDSYLWETHIANEIAAQSFLPLETQHTTYTEAWLASIASEDLQQREALFQVHAEQQSSDYSHEIRSQVNGRTIWLSEDVHINSVSENQWHLVGVCTDISERKQVAMQLQRYNEELEARVEERTAAITAANDVMEQEIAVRKRAEEAERTQRILAEALRDSVAAINQTLDRDSVLDTLLVSMASVVPHDAASIMLLEAPNQVRVVRQIGHPTLDNQVYDITAWGNLQHIIRTGEPFTTEDTSLVPDWGQVESSRWIRSNMSVPIILENEVVGFLNLDSKQPHYFTQQHAEWLFAFAHQAGTAIRNARLVEAIRNDALTLQQRIDEQTAALQSERAQLEAILNAMLDGVLYQPDTLSSTPQYTNAALTQITGYTQEEWLGGTAQREINTSERTQREALFRRVERVLEHQGYWEGEATFRRKDGRTFDAALIRSDVRDSTGKRQGIVTVVRDISQAKELEEQKARFIASASHELRTPIANMKTRLFLMKRVPERFTEHITIAESVAELMQKLVEDMFDISRFQRGLIPIKPEAMVLQDVIRQIAAYQEPEAERQQIMMKLDMPDAPIHLEADPYRLSQVLINLLKNALNYTPVEGTIEVVAAVEGDEAVIQVIDTGIGIAAEALPQLFEPFFRLSEDNKGAGLGLSITKEIVEAHGGAITVDSTVGKGSCFTVRLPLKTRIKTSEMER